MDNIMDAEMEPELNTYVWGVQGKGLLEFNILVLHDKFERLETRDIGNPPCFQTPNPEP